MSIRSAVATAVAGVVGIGVVAALAIPVVSGYTDAQRAGNVPTVAIGEGIDPNIITDSATDALEKARIQAAIDEAARIAEEARLAAEAEAARVAQAAADEAARLQRIADMAARESKPQPVTVTVRPDGTTATVAPVPQRMCPAGSGATGHDEGGDTMCLPVECFTVANDPATTPQCYAPFRP